MTVFAGSLESTNVDVTWKPRPCSCELAVSNGCPRTSGTDTGCGPFETLMRTFVPSLTFVPPDGSCAVTTPADLLDGTSCTSGTRCASLSAATASVDCRSTTDGTSTFGTPVDTQIFTGFPFGI